MSISKLPGKILVNEFSLINNYGTVSQTKTEIWPIVIGASLYENIFDYEMWGMAKICDSNNLYSTLPITSDTYVKIVMQDPTTGQSVKGLYRIYKVSNIEQESPKLQNYIIHFISTEAFTSKNVRISKKVLGNIPAVVKDIHNTFSNKPIELTNDSTKSNLLIPYFTAKDSIELLLNNAKYKGMKPDYCYWETFRGYNCKSLTACALENPMHDLSTNTTFNMEVGEGFKYADFIKIDEIRGQQNFDKLKTLYHGYDGSTVFVYNPLEGSCNNTKIGQEPLSKVFTFSSNAIDYNNLSKRNQILFNISNTYYYVHVPGLISRSSGDMANVTVYNGNQLEVKDTTLSGKRLICGIVHIISRDDYYQNITLANYELAS